MRAALLILTLLAGLFLSSCAARPRPPRDPEAPLPRASSDLLTPTRLAIHPLTRYAPDVGGRPAVIANIELLDRFDQNTRALGVLRLRILPPGSGLPEISAPTDSTWLIDLTDPEQNARQYDDLITRTYTFTLSPLPEWITRWAARAAESRSAVGNADVSPPLLVAEFMFADSDGKTRSLRDSSRLSP